MQTYRVCAVEAMPSLPDELSRFPEMTGGDVLVLPLFTVSLRLPVNGSLAGHCNSCRAVPVVATKAFLRGSLVLYVFELRRMHIVGGEETWSYNRQKSGIRLNTW
ncbi:hypothetical protein L3C95_02820 [Chitinophaga filiformis]|uniref:hypothetical protein n=1 Tax=Chitinophaga filiformis TaxID=104663 RepID=UPI001F3DCE3D|nr:hypothetical protein [Chitinophaga filiformis]MCF6401788.1 hypothetical protein [Chitinophaga filiformis]